MWGLLDAAVDGQASWTARVLGGEMGPSGQGKSSSLPRQLGGLRTCLTFLGPFPSVKRKVWGLPLNVLWQSKTASSFLSDP